MQRQSEPFLHFHSIVIEFFSSLASFWATIISLIFYLFFFKRAQALLNDQVISTSCPIILVKNVCIVIGSLQFCIAIYALTSTASIIVNQVTDKQ